MTSVYSDNQPLLRDNTGINSVYDEEDKPMAGEVHETASVFRKVLYVGLLVIFGSMMTLVISAQDRYCIANCVGRPETFPEERQAIICAAYKGYQDELEAICRFNGTVPPKPDELYASSARPQQPATVWFVSSSKSWGVASDPVTECPSYCLDAADDDDIAFNETCAALCCNEEAFHQPFVQLFQMGCGQVLTGLFFPFYRHSPTEGGRPMGDPTFKQFAPKAALASIFDALAEVFIILGLGLTAPATAEMMKATLVIFTGVMSSWWFKDFALSRKQWVATAVMLAGASMVIAQEYIFPDNCDFEEDKRGPLEEVVGALFTIVAQIFYAMQFITEETLIDENKVRNLHVNKALLVFCEGWVSILSAIILQVPFTYVADPDLWDGFAEDVNTYFREPFLWGLGIALSAAVAGFDIWGLLTAEHMGSDLRAVVCASFQVVLVWTISLTVTYFGESFNPVALVGFIIILVAGLAYSYTAQKKEDPRSKERLLDLKA